MKDLAYIVFVFYSLWFFFFGIITIGTTTPGVLFCTGSDWAGLDWAGPRRFTWLGKYIYLGILVVMNWGITQGAKHWRSPLVRVFGGWKGQEGLRLALYLSSSWNQCILALLIYMYGLVIRYLPIYNGHVREWMYLINGYDNLHYERGNVNGKIST